MENSFFNTTFTDIGLSRFKNLRLLMVGLILLFAGQMATAQKVPANCAGNAALYSGTFTDPTTATSTDGKLQLLGAIGPNDRVIFNVGSTVTGSVNFAAAAKYSTFASGNLLTNLGNPAIAGQDYSIRVYTSDTLCYVDFKVTQPHVNFSVVPLFPDINVTAAASPTSGLAVGSLVTDVITIKNEGDTTATNVEVTIGVPSSLSYKTGSAVASGGTTYNETTKIWSVGTLAKGQSRTLSIQVVITKEGVSYITAYTTKENDPYGTSIDKDSTPSAIPAGEDDEASTCISTPFYMCSGDAYKLFLPANHYYQNFAWTFTAPGGSPQTVTIGGNISGVVMNADSSLSITKPGTFTWSYKIGACAVSSCCAVTVADGPKPILVRPTNVNPTTCSTVPLTSITVTKSDTLTNVLYQWYNANGTSNPTTTAIAGQTTNILTGLPTTAGTYKYLLVAQNGRHISCQDTITFTFKVNAKPAGPGQPLASNITYCQSLVANTYGAPLVPTGVGSNVLHWFASATGTAFSLTAPSPLISTAGSFSFYVSLIDPNGCESDRTTIVVLVNPYPIVPVVTSPVVLCQNATVSSNLSVLANVTGITNQGNWYTGYGSTTSSTTIPTPSSTTPGSTVYYVSQTITATGCEGPKATIVVNVNPQPVASVVTQDPTCGTSGAQSNGKLILSRYKNTDVATWNLGTTFNSATAKPTPLPGITPPTTGTFAGTIVSTLPNPTAATDSYTVRITNSFGCAIDVVKAINKVTCNCAATCEPATITKTN